MRRNGWTLTELLIAIAIVAIIVLFVWIGVKNQIARGYDTRRKTDLSLISKAFEEYYNDNSCYPPAGILDTCGGNALMPYLDKIPCDPVNKTMPYLYVPEDDPCDGQRLCAALQDKSDPAIGKLGCDAQEGCGWGAGYNFCLGVGVQITAPGFVPQGGTPTPTPTPGGGGGPTPTSTPTSTPGPTSTPTPTPTGPTSTPTPTPTPGGGGSGFACTPSGDCNSYADPGGAGCPIWWQGGCLAGACDNPANRCAF